MCRKFPTGLRSPISQMSQTMVQLKKKKKSHIMYWDTNKLYGCPMSQYMPHGGFQWCDPTKFNAETIMNLPDEAMKLTSHCFWSWLNVPESLHNDHNDYPLAPQSLTFQEDMLSDYAKNLLQKAFRGTPKLIPNLMNKIKYISHYRNIKLYMQLDSSLQTSTVLSNLNNPLGSSSILI